MSMQCARVDWLESFCPTSTLEVGKKNKHEANADCCLLIHMCKKALTFPSTCVCVYSGSLSGLVCVCVTRLRAKMQVLSRFLCAETTNCRVGRFRWGTTKTTKYEKTTTFLNYNIYYASSIAKKSILFNGLKFLIWSVRL